MIGKYQRRSSPDGQPESSLMSIDKNRPRAGVYKEITSLTNPIIKELRGLTQRKNRQASNQFLAEGLKLVASAVESGWTISTFVFAKKMADHALVQELAAKTKARGGMVLEVSEAVLSKDCAPR